MEQDHYNLRANKGVHIHKLRMYTTIYLPRWILTILAKMMLQQHLYFLSLLL